MLLAIIVVAAFIMLARYLPIQKVVLAEGVFDCEKTEFNLRTNKKDRIWYFKYPRPPQYRQLHIESCDWCKKLLLLDGESLNEIERLKQRHLA